MAPVSLRPGPLGVGGILANSFAVFRRRFGLFLLLGLVPYLFLVGLGLLLVVVAVVVEAGAAASGGRRELSGIVRALALLAIPVVLMLPLVQAKADAMAALAADDLQNGQRADFAGVFERSRGVARRVLGICLLFGPMLLAGAAVLGVLGWAFTDSTPQLRPLAVVVSGVVLLLTVLLLTVRWFVLIPAVAIEKNTGYEALGRSWRLTAGGFWRIVGAFIPVYLLEWLASVAGSRLNPMSAISRALDTDRGAVSSALITAIPSLIAVALLGLGIRALSDSFLAVMATVVHRDQILRSHASPSGWSAPVPYPSARSSSPYAGTPSGYGTASAGYGSTLWTRPDQADPNSARGPAGPVSSQSPEAWPSGGSWPYGSAAGPSGGDPNAGGSGSVSPWQRPADPQ